MFWRFRVSRDEQPEPPSSLDGYSPHEAPQELAFLQASKLYHQDFIFNIYSSFMCKGRAKKIKPSEKWIMYSKRSGLRPYLDEVFKSVKITPNIQCEIVEDTAALGLVAINYGIALAPNINIIKLYDLKVINIENKLEDRKIYMASLKNRYLTPSVNKFINFMIHNTFNNQEFENE